MARSRYVEYKIKNIKIQLNVHIKIHPNAIKMLYEALKTT